MYWQKLNVLRGPNLNVKICHGKKQEQGSLQTSNKNSQFNLALVQDATYC
jgi:hypothetical protein